jgi:hypothetical protein
VWVEGGLDRAALLMLLLYGAVSRVLRYCMGVERVPYT